MAADEPAMNPRFKAENKDVEDRLKAETIGLLQLSDFRKRRAEAIQGKSQPSSRSVSPSTNAETKRTTKRKAPPKGNLSFGDDDDDDEDNESSVPIQRKKPTLNPTDGDQDRNQDQPPPSRPRPRPRVPNTSTGLPTAKSMTKSAQAKETATKERLRLEFQATQRAVRATDFILPFVFYDGTTTPGSESCRVKKGDQVWIFLDRARKAGAVAAAAATAAGTGTLHTATPRLSNSSAGLRASWARISVDDLLLVRGDMILPHHYTFYHFMLERSRGYQGRLFAHSADRTTGTPDLVEDPGAEDERGGLSLYGVVQPKITQPAIEGAVGSSSLVPDELLEGYGDDPGLTKVVDRRWYEKNKHIYPASTWEVFDPEADYTTKIRRDAMGNVYHRGP